MSRLAVIALLLSGCATTQQDALLKGAIADLERKSYGEAQLKLEELLRSDPRNPEACARLGDLYSRDRKYEQAIRVLRACGNLDNADVQESLGLALFKSQSPPPDEAIVLLERAVAQNGNALTARLLLGQHYAANDPCRASDHLLVSLQAMEDEVDARQAALMVLMRCGRWAVAEHHAEILMRLAPNDPASLVFLAGARMAQKKWAQAALLYQILVNDPDHPPAHELNLARCRAEMSKESQPHAP